MRSPLPWTQSIRLNCRLPRLFLALLAASLLQRDVFGAPEVAQIRPESVVVLANASDPGSMRIAEHYAEVRHVPTQNIVSIPLKADETTDWHTFVADLWQPLLERLVRDRWIDAIAMDLVDDVGRRKYVVNSHHIGALVVCRGVPLRISDDHTLYRENVPYTRHAEYRTNCGSVDGELALLPQPNHPINAFVSNALFQKLSPPSSDEQQVVRVSRLDGPTVEDANALVDRAVEAENQGLLGRAYVDLSNYDATGNRWFEATATELAELGFDTDVDRAPEVMPAEARFDAPVLYFGWYAGNITGACNLRGLRFPPGAIALHLHSYSAASMRSDSQGWTGPFVARGVTATVGNVFEPYLQMTHRPNLLVHALARGATWVEAGYYALPALSWQQVLIGDPLYRPFAKSVDYQLAQIDALPRPLAEYAAIRKANLLDRSHRSDEALVLLKQTERESPSPAVALALAARMGEGKEAQAIEERAFANVSAFRSDQWALARSVALQFVAHQHAAAAVSIWSTLLPELPADLKAKWIEDAINAAHGAGDDARAEAWEDERRKLVPAG